MREVTLLGEVHKLQWYLLDGITIHEYRRTPLGSARDKLIVATLFTEHPFGSLTEEQMSTGKGIEPSADPRGQWWLNGVIGYVEPWVKVNNPGSNMVEGDVADAGDYLWVFEPQDVEQKGPLANIQKREKADIDITRDAGGKIIDVRPKVSR